MEIYATSHTDGWSAGHWSLTRGVSIYIIWTYFNLFSYGWLSVALTDWWGKQSWNGVQDTWRVLLRTPAQKLYGINNEDFEFSKSNIMFTVTENGCNLGTILTESEIWNQSVLKRRKIIITDCLMAVREREREPASNSRREGHPRETTICISDSRHYGKMFRLDDPTLPRLYRKYYLVLWWIFLLRPSRYISLSDNLSLPLDPTSEVNDVMTAG